MRRICCEMTFLGVDSRIPVKKYIYMAATLDHPTASKLSIDDIRALVDAMIEAHGDRLPRFH